MDKGAHYYRCDFQVHTPRDLRWNGDDAVSEDERRIYSNELVLACRAKNLNAIAITDHHDFTFFKYIKEAAQHEVDDTNVAIPLENQLVVFPGMELTLSSPPCQALLLLDSDFPVDLLTSVYPVLAINQTTEQDSKCAPVVKLTCAQTFEELYEVLNRNDFLKDRFIIIPNVSEGGRHTLLRAGFNIYYQKMPCVGGYLDGAHEQLGSGNLNIIAGKDRNYGSKSLGIFQTSDNRQRDHVELGKYSTWVKWAVPSAEAIRQACLAKESRISQGTPEIPSIYITSIDVSNSKFMGQIDVELNPQYNAIIGGRGTGKSTVLEYIRWGLCDQLPESISRGEEMPVYQDKRKKLIDKTLLPFDPTVQIAFIKNNITHVVRRKASTKEIFLKIGDGEFELCKEDIIRNLLPIQAYSQKQLSGIGVSMEELKRLIYSPIRQNLNELNVSAAKVASEIRNCYELIQRKLLLEKHVERNDLESKSLTKQVEGLRKGLKGLTEEDKKTIAIHRQYEFAEQIIDEWTAGVSYAEKTVEDLKNEISEYSFETPDEIKLPEEEKNLLDKLQEEVSGLFGEINADISSLESKVKQRNILFNQSIKELKEKIEQHNVKYKSAKEKSTSQETILSQIQKIEDRLNEIRKDLTEKRQGLSKIGNPETKFDQLKDEWFKVNEEKGNHLEAQCNSISVLSDGNLKASLQRGHETSNLEETLKTMTSGAKIRKEKIGDLCNRIRMADKPIEEWLKILYELKEISFFDITQEASSPLPDTPILSSMGFTANELRRMSEKLNSTNWIDLFLVELEDLPIFQYQTRDGEYIDFSDASAGQQATALIHVLLNQEGPTLIIDQPEDDLDNQMVSNIAELIWKSKKKRQLIFTSHNANIVVNGDAELVVCCGYKITGDQSKGEIQEQGAIDVEGVRRKITDVMEGGEDAFKLRKEKYGF